MDFLIEIFLELLVEGGIEIGFSSKISPWVRYPILFLIASLFLFVIGLILIVGIMSLRKNVLFGLLFLVIGIYLLYSFIYQLKKKIKEKKSQHS